MNLYPLKDLKTIPDIVQEYKPSYLKNQPLIIDNGSYQCRAGWANRKEPMMVFKNIIAKPRKDRTNKKEETPIQPATLIGNDIVNIEAMRFQLRTQFDRNVVTHFYIQEQIFDYIFKTLGINTQGIVNHPVMITEPMVNPNFTRSLMSELLFEVYNIPSLCYGIDSLLSFNYNNVGDTGMIISIGFSTTHVIPVVDGHYVTSKMRRINIGGSHMINYLYRLLQLKYPVHVNSITLSRIEELLHDHCSIALDYVDSLRSWASPSYYEKNIKKIQLPFSQVVAAPTLTAEQKVEKRKELSRRLAEINARKREEKLAEDEDLMDKLLNVQDLFDDEDNEEFEEALKDVNLTTYEELEKMIISVQARIDKTKLKISEIESGGAPVFEEKPIIQPIIPQPPANRNFDEWLNEVKEKRILILEKKQVRKQRRQDLAKRRTAAAQERMRIISKLAGKEKGTDDFGMRDADWDVYKKISKEGGDSDSEAENEKLLECEEILRHHDPLNEEPQQQGMAEYHQLHFSVEAIRASELLFQPNMLGLGEAGLAETIDYVLKMFPADVQMKMVNNIFLTGGISKMPGLLDRLNKELQEMRPFESKFQVKMAKDPCLDGWYGARKFTATGDNLKTKFITRKDYEEMGSEYLKEHFASNKYYKTPAMPLKEEMI